MRPLSILGVLLTVAACAQVPPLKPRVVLPGESVGGLFWLFAPHIAVVKVRSAGWLGPEIEITPPQKTVVHLVRVDGEIENVIQGDLSKGSIRFYFFANTLSPNGYMTIKYWLTPGRRYVVFLREDGGVLRVMADLAPPEILLLGGRHDRIDVQGNQNQHDPGKAILYLALTPTTDYDRGFASNIQATESVIQELVKPADLAYALRNLLTHPDPAIQAQACLTLARRFRYRDPCLPKLLDSPELAVRQQATLWMQGRREGTQELLTTLRERPFSLIVSGSVEDLPGELELFTLDWDPEVRQQACGTLRRLFPSSRFSRCSAARGN